MWLSGLVMTLIVALRYLAVSGLFAWLTAHVRPGHYAGLGAQMRREIIWSLATAAIYGMPAGIILWGWQEHGWTKIYTDIGTDKGAWPLWWIPVSLFVYLALHDTWFYWTHRWMHQPRVFRAIHAVHHASRPPTAWAAMNFHPVEAVIVGLFIPLLVFVIPVHAGVLMAVLMVMTVMGVTNHMGWEMFPKVLVHATVGEWVITASHHHRHHELYRCNFGLYFRFWDHLCGTDKGLSNP